MQNRRKFPLLKLFLTRQHDPAVEVIKMEKELKIYSSEIALLKDKMKLHVDKGHECNVVEAMKMQI
jgi:hypothetical protein